MLSVELLQLRSISEVETATATRLVGTDGGSVSMTDTVTWAETLPALLEAVRVKVVVLLSDAMVERPLTGPTPLSMNKLGAGLPETVQESVEEPALVMLDGDALNEEIAGGTLGVKVVALAVVDWPETLVAASNAAIV
jgi:hypothetical protein